MNKTAIKNFAIWARRELITKVSQRAKLYGIEKDHIEADLDSNLRGDLLTAKEKQARKKLIEKIEKDGFDQTIEEVAYTWFNRIIALRFMEINAYLPSHIRVFTNENNQFYPQILAEAVNIDLENLDRKVVLDLYNKGNREEDLYKYLFICQCKDLSTVLPGMFENINDYTEILLIDGLLKEDSIIGRMIGDIPEEDWQDQVQIIGWLYQFYNEEVKDEIFARSKRDKFTKDEIPAATQLFTPDWIVRYMVENSLGRLWLEGHPDNGLKAKWRYYLEEADQEEDVKDQIKKIKETYGKINPEDIKCIDPAAGSGHILVYIFDVLIQIYQAYGYKTKDAVRSILENNIYGLDIDERARQLAYFSLMMEAIKYDRRFLSRNYIPQPKVYTIRSSNDFNEKVDAGVLEYFINGDEDLRADIDTLIKDMKNADEYGSIVKTSLADYERLNRRLDQIISSDQLPLYYDKIMNHILPLVRQGEILSNKYDVVVTNPPYMGGARMSPKLSKYIGDIYPDSKADLFAVFMEKCIEMTKANGLVAMITQNSWMFLSSYEKLREKIQNKNLINMAHLGPRAFEEIGGEVVQTTAFILANNFSENYKGKYLRLVDGQSQDEKEELFLKREKVYTTCQKNFKKIPGMPIAYWASNRIYEIFENEKIKKRYEAKEGVGTRNDNYFLKKIWEIDKNKINKKWLMTDKAGSFRKWFQGFDNVMNWENDGYEIKNYRNKDGSLKSRPQNLTYLYRQGITWGKVTSGDVSFRYRPKGYGFNDAAPTLFTLSDMGYSYILGFLNSNTNRHIIKNMGETINTTCGVIENLPLIFSDKYESKVDFFVNKNINISKQDWDMHETSWDFEKSPLLSNKVDGRVETAYESYKFEVNERFTKLKENEEELNRIFIEVYNLKDELTPEVSDKDITVAKIFDSKKDIDDEIKGNRYVMTRENVVKNFLSYFIGCVMGRYSLDEEGLVFAGGEFDPSKYRSFKADSDGIIPLTDREYLADDIINRLVDFLLVTFGEEYLEENLDFLAQDLKGQASDTSKDKIRNYFINDFYKDHCKKYKKTPIYWQYDSGPNNGCKGLFYLHRYNKDTFAKIRINYIFEIQDRYKQEITRLEDLIKTASTRDKIQLQKNLDSFRKKLLESQKFEEQVQHLADAYIDLDLDDGVKENYKVFANVLSKIK